MDAKRLEILNRTPIFNGLSEAALSQLSKDSVIHHLERDDILIREGEPSSSLFVIRSGWVKVVRTGPEDKEIVLNQLGPGQIIGETAMIDREARSATAIAISPMLTLELTYDGFLTALEQHPQLMIAFIGDMFERLRFANVYIQKAIEWSQKVAEGNYDFVENQIQSSQATIVDVNEANEIRVGAFLSALFKMVKDVKAREEHLKEQIMLVPKIQIDQTKRNEEVDNLSKRSFFMRVQNTAEEMRERRRRRLEEEPPED